MISGIIVAVSQSDFIKYSLIKYSVFKEIQNNIFVSPDTTKNQQIQLINLIKNSKHRIREKFGEFTATAIIISTHNKDIRKQYSNNCYAGTLSLPFNDNRAYIFIGENGHNIDIISHELVHAEVFSHLGYIATNSDGVQ